MIITHLAIARPAGVKSYTNVITRAENADLACASTGAEDKELGKRMHYAGTTKQARLICVTFPTV